MDENKKKMFMNIVKGGAVILCIFFFTLPLVQCSQSSNLKASGWEIATGTGNLNRNIPGNNSGEPLAFILIIAPIVLFYFAFKNKPFKTLRYTAIAGLGSQIIFMLVAYSRLNSGTYRGAFKLTGSNWVILLIYAGLVYINHYCIQQEEAEQIKNENS